MVLGQGAEGLRILLCVTQQATCRNTRKCLLAEAAMSSANLCFSVLWQPDSNWKSLERSQRLGHWSDTLCLCKLLSGTMVIFIFHFTFPKHKKELQGKERGRE